MYSERKDSFSIKTVILQFLFVALFIFILIWLFPMKSDVKSILKNSGNNTAETDLSVFYDQIFNDNVIAMKEAAKSYYTTPRLPKNVGDKVSMTLGEMLDKKIILPFVDSDGKQCDLTSSYVEVTKYEDEFVMKVNLKCSNQENYLLVYMGCYDYCSTTICEKNASDVKTPVIYPTNAPAKVETPVIEVPKTTTTTVTTNTVITNVTTITNHIVHNTTITIIQPTPKPTPTPKPEPKPEPKPTPTTPSCSLQVVSGQKSGNNYTGNVTIGFTSKTSGENATLTGFGLGTSKNYNGEVEYTLSKTGTHTVYGYVKNSFGNTSVCSIEVTIEDKKPEPKPEPKPTPTTPSCSLQVVSGENSGNNYTGNVTIGFKSRVAGDNATLTGFGLGTSTNYNGDTKYTLKKPGTYTVYGYVKNSFGNTAVCSIVVTIQEEQKVKEYEWEYSRTTTTCSDYSDWSDWSTTYVEPTDLRQVAYRKVKKHVSDRVTTYKDTSKPIYATKDVIVGTLEQNICTEYGYQKTGNVVYTDWVYGDYITSPSAQLKNTDLTMYIPVTDTETLCREGFCSSTTGHVYRVKTRKAISGAIYTCKSTAKVTKLIPAQKTVIVDYENATKTEPIYDIETQYRYRTKSCDTNTDYKWSFYNDTKLLGAGYTYTGKKREK